MKLYPLIAIALMATISFSYGFYLVGFIFLVWLIFCVGLIFYLGSVLALFINMPTYWQNMSETMEIAKKSGYSVDDRKRASVSRIFFVITKLNLFFEVSVNEKVVSDFENVLNVKVDSFKTVQEKAIYYFTEVNKENPELLLYIVNAIKVRKRIGLGSRTKEGVRDEALN